jgi:hypothetical protein
MFGIYERVLAIILSPKLYKPLSPVEISYTPH